MVAEILSLDFMAWGHPNIRCGHGTTLMVTKDPNVSTRGDCVAAVAAEVGLADLPAEFKATARRHDTVIELTMEAGTHRFTVVGRGHPGLTYDHPRDMVARRSGYTCGRTLMVDADKAAKDIPGVMLPFLQGFNSVIRVTLTLRR